MLNLSQLSNTSRPAKKVQRVGRGMASNRGKTCGRGHKGDKARMGYKRNYGREGGPLPLYRKLPCRGFTNSMFKSSVFTVNLTTINDLFQDGEVVTLQALYDRGCNVRRSLGGFKVLGDGEISKKVSIEAQAISESAKLKLEDSGIPYKIVN
ncbi:MAG: 50S ribosomal protein L15 [Rhabdochlamydiaceae bacterium]